MQFKKLLFASMFLIGSVFAITSCSGYFHGKSGIVGKIEKGEISKATCNIQGLDKTGQPQGDEITATFNPVDSSYSTKIVPNAPALEVSCEVAEYTNEVTHKLVTVTDQKFNLTTVSKADASQANMNVLTTLATDKAIEAVKKPGTDITTAMKKAIGDKYKAITGKDLPKTYDPATADLNNDKLKEATMAVLYIVNDAENKKNLNDVFDGAVKDYELKDSFQAAEQNQAYKDFKKYYKPTPIGGVPEKVTHLELIQNNAITIPTLGTVSTTTPTPDKAKWDGDRINGYTLVLPSNYKDGDTANFGIKVTNGKDKVLVISNGTTAVTSTAAIKGNTEQDITIGNIQSLLTDVDKPVTLYICVVTDNPGSDGTKCTKDTAGKATLTVTKKLAPITEKTEYTLALPNTYANNVPTTFHITVSNGNGEYLAISSGSTVNDVVSTTQITSDTAADVTSGDIHPLLLSSSLSDTNPVTLYICVVDSATPDTTSCTDDEDKHLATLTVTQEAADTTKPKLGKAGTTPATPSNAIFDVKTKETKYTLAVPDSYTDNDKTTFHIEVSNGSGEYLAVSSGSTVNDVVSEKTAITSDTAADVASDDIHSLLLSSSLSDTNPVTLYICVVDSATPDTTSCTDDEDKHLATLTVTVIPTTVTPKIVFSQSKIGSTPITSNGFDVGNVTDLNFTFAIADVHNAVTDAKYFIISDASGAKASKVVSGTADVDDLFIDNPNPTTFTVCMLPSTATDGSACTAGLNAADGKKVLAIATFTATVVPTITFKDSTIGTGKTAPKITDSTIDAGTAPEFYFDSKDAKHVPKEAKYFIISDASGVTAIPVTAGTANVDALFKDNPDSTKFTVCMLPSTATNGSNCTAGLSADEHSTDVLAVATFTATVDPSIVFTASAVMVGAVQKPITDTVMEINNTPSFMFDPNDAKHAPADAKYFITSSDKKIDVSQQLVKDNKAPTNIIPLIKDNHDEEIIFTVCMLSSTAASDGSDCKNGVSVDDNSVVNKKVLAVATFKAKIPVIKSPTGPTITCKQCTIMDISDPGHPYLINKNEHKFDNPIGSDTVIYFHFEPSTNTDNAPANAQYAIVSKSGAVQELTSSMANITSLFNGTEETTFKICMLAHGVDIKTCTPNHIVDLDHKDVLDVYTFTAHLETKP